MKKILGIAAIAATLICCNTPQPATTDTNTSTDPATNSNNMNQSTTTDTTGQRSDSLRH